MRKTIIAAAALGCIGAAAGAAPAPAGNAAGRLIQSFTACRGVADPNQRLACFDKATAGLEASVAAKDLTIIDKQEVRATRRSLFGFTLPKFSIFGGGDDKDDKAPAAERKEFTELNTTIADVKAFGYLKYELRLPDDAVWQTSEPLNDDAPRVGDKIRITKSAFGGYLLDVNRGRPVRAMRLR